MKKRRSLFVVSILILVCMVFMSCENEPDIVSVSEIKFANSEVSVAKGDTVRLDLSFIPSNANQGKGITWKSSAEDVATIDAVGNVKGLEYGKSVITATSEAGLKAEITVSVVDYVVSADATMSKYLEGKEPESITSLILGGTLSTDDFATLNGMPKLASLDLSAADNTEIPKNAFKKNEVIVDIKLPSNLKEIGFLAFSQSAIEELIMPDTVDWISNAVFFYATELKKVHVSTSLTSIPVQTFAGCYKLTTVELHDGIESIGFQAFYQTSSLDTDDHILRIPASCEKIGYKAFMDSLDNITAIEFNEGLKRIEHNVFDKAFDTVVYPSTLTELSDTSFTEVPKNIEFKSMVPPELVPNKDNNDENFFAPTLTGIENTKVIVPVGAKEAYLDSVWFKGTDVYKSKEAGNHDPLFYYYAKENLSEKTSD